MYVPIASSSELFGSSTPLKTSRCAVTGGQPNDATCTVQRVQRVTAPTGRAAFLQSCKLAIGEAAHTHHGNLLLEFVHGVLGAEC